MMVKVMREQEVLQKAAEVLVQHMSPVKVARFCAVWQVGGGNYLVNGLKGYKKFEQTIGYDIRGEIS